MAKTAAKRISQRFEAVELINEAKRHSAGTPDLIKVLSGIPVGLTFAIDLFLSEFDYQGNKTSNRAIALRTLASIVSALDLAIKEVNP